MDTQYQGWSCAGAKSRVIKRVSVRRAAPASQFRIRRGLAVSPTFRVEDQTLRVLRYRA
jgi:hypothetical protein